MIKIADKKEEHLEFYSKPWTARRIILNGQPFWAVLKDYSTFAATYSEKSILENEPKRWAPSFQAMVRYIQDYYDQAPF